MAENMPRSQTTTLRNQLISWSHCYLLGSLRSGLEEKRSVLVESTVEGWRVMMRQKLFLLFLVGFLITAPALADPANPVRVSDTSGFGAGPIALGTDTTGPPPFTLSLDVEVFNDGGVYTYVYKITHDATLLNSLQIFNNLFDATNPLNWGWVDPAPSSNPFSVAIDIDPNVAITTFQFGNFPAGMLTIYVQSTLSPTSTATEFVFGSGTPDGGTGFLLTLGPALAGTGASFGVPEPSSLLLLTFGLLSGGVLRLSTRRNRG